MSNATNLLTRRHFMTNAGGAPVWLATTTNQALASNRNNLPKPSGQMIRSIRVGRIGTLQASEGDIAFRWLEIGRSVG